MNLAQKALALGIVTLAAALGSDPAQAQYPNPIVAGSRFESSDYDPFSDHWTIDRRTDLTRRSFFDPDRSDVDPGSFEYVDRYYRDRFGRLVHEHGTKWTSGGRPHGNVTRDYVTHSPGGRFRPGVTVNDSTTIHYSTRPGVTERSRTRVQYSPRPSVTERDRTTVQYLRRP